MKKKSKILALIMALVVCFSLILSLCSFTTTKSEDYYVYSPLGYDIDIGYTYHRITSTLDEYYFGEIPEFNRILASSSGSSYYAKASDYVIVSNDSINYDNVYFDGINSEVQLVCESPGKSYFNGLIKYRGLINELSVTDDILTLSPDSASLSPDTFYVSIDYEGFYNVDGQLMYIPEQYFTVPYQLFISSFTQSGDDYYYSFSMSRLFELIFSNASHGFGVPNNDIMLTRVNIDFSTDTLGNNYTYDYIQYNCSLYDEYNNSTDYFNVLTDYFNKAENLGYNNGFNDGFNSGSVSWNSFTDFLKSTVSGFLDFEFVPNISLGNILSVILGLLLVFTFLRIFAGG